MRIEGQHFMCFYHDPRAITAWNGAELPDVPAFFPRQTDCLLPYIPGKTMTATFSH